MHSPTEVGVPSAALDTGSTEPVAVLTAACASPPAAATTAVAATAAAMTRARRRARGGPWGAPACHRRRPVAGPDRTQPGDQEQQQRRRRAGPGGSPGCAARRARRPAWGTTWRTRCTASPSSCSSHGSRCRVRVALGAGRSARRRGRPISTTRCTVRWSAPGAWNTITSPTRTSLGAAPALAAIAAPTGIDGVIDGLGTLRKAMWPDQRRRRSRTRAARADDDGDRQRDESQRVNPLRSVTVPATGHRLVPARCVPAKAVRDHRRLVLVRVVRRGRQRQGHPQVVRGRRGGHDVRQRDVGAR